MEIYLVDKKQRGDKDFINSVVQVDHTLFPFPWTVKQWNEAFPLQENIFIAAQIGNDLVGFCLFHYSKLEQMGHLLKIIVNPKYRKQNIALKMHDIAVQEIISRGGKFLYLEVETSNVSAIKLYEKLGYHNLTCKRGFYSTGTDAFAMQKEII